MGLPFVLSPASRVEPLKMFLRLLEIRELLFCLAKAAGMGSLWRYFFFMELVPVQHLMVEDEFQHIVRKIRAIESTGDLDAVADRVVMTEFTPGRCS